MPVSIRSQAKSQSLFLANKEHELYGSKKGQEFKLDTVTQALVDIAGLLADTAANNLEANGNTASGNLAKSIKPRDPQISGRTIKVDVQALHYYAYINKGVRGTQSGTGLFAFKSKYPGKAMIANLMEGINRAKEKTTSSNTKYTISKLEVKNKTLSELSNAYGAAHNILKFGIAPTGFFDKAVADAKKNSKETLGKALKIDIINSLPNKL